MHPIHGTGGAPMFEALHMFSDKVECQLPMTQLHNKLTARHPSTTSAQTTSINCFCDIQFIPNPCGFQMNHLYDDWNHLITNSLIHRKLSVTSFSWSIKYS
jgi:hypothetical protein